MAAFDAPSPHTRATLLWIALTLAAIGTFIVVITLYLTAQRGIAEQAQRTIEQESGAFLNRATAFTESARLTAFAELISFHEEGLPRALRQWDEANVTITGTFIWHPGDPPSNQVPAKLWTTPDSDVAWVIETFSTLEHPELSSTSLGYQDENLETLNYAGREAAPVVGWTAYSPDSSPSWTIWYRAGPAEPVRGVFIDVTPLIEELQSELPAPATVQSVIHLHGKRTLAGNKFPLPLIPSHQVTFAPGEIFEERQANTRLAGAIAALLLIALLAAVTLLARASQRDAREARRKTTFVSLVSHELRTPVTAIRMFADMLTTPELPAAQRQKFTTHIQHESSRLGDLIDRLLSFNNARSTASVPLSTPLCPLLRETVEVATPQLTATGLIPKLDLPSDEITVITDREAVRQTLLNLLDNACKYAGHSGNVTMTLRTRASHALIQVSDQGPGVPSAHRTRIFEPFEQGHNQLHDKRPGLGLGLAISRSALRAAGGDLALASTNHGARFEITLPLDSAS